MKGHTGDDAMSGLPKLARVPTDFGFTEEHGLLATSARRFLSQHWDRDALRGFVEGTLGEGEPVDTAPLEAAMAELGWFDLVVDEAAGGAGLGWLHAALLAEELGRVLCPVRWAGRALASATLGVAGAEATITFDASDVVLDADRLTGTHPMVPGAMAARELVAPVGDGWVVVSLDGAERRARAGQDPTRAIADVTHDGAEARGLDGVDTTSLAIRAWLLHACEGVGAAETVLGMTRDYAAERQQFGRPIGTFQAVSHPIVDTMIAIERARNLAYATAAALDAGSETARIEPMARMAKIAADDALWDAACRGVQLHGGFGFTWECDVHFYLRRALSARSELGSAARHREAVAARLLRG